MFTRNFPAKNISPFRQTHAEIPSIAQSFYDSPVKLKTGYVNAIDLHVVNMLRSRQFYNVESVQYDISERRFMSFYNLMTF